MPGHFQQRVSSPLLNWAKDHIQLFLTPPSLVEVRFSGIKMKCEGMT
jgi:hypothetical protein